MDGGSRRAGAAGAGSAAAVAVEGAAPPPQRRRRLREAPLEQAQEGGLGRIRDGAAAAAGGRSSSVGGRGLRRPLRCEAAEAEAAGSSSNSWQAGWGQRRAAARDGAAGGGGQDAGSSSPASSGSRSSSVLGRRLWAGLCVAVSAVALCHASPLPGAHAFVCPRPAPRASGLTRRPALSKLSPAGAVISQPKPSSGPAAAPDAPPAGAMGAHTHHHGHGHGHQSHTAQAHAAMVSSPSPAASAAAVKGAEPATIARAMAAPSAAASAAAPPETPGAPSLLWGSAVVQPSPVAQQQQQPQQPQPGEGGLVIAPPAGGVEVPMDSARREVLLQEAYAECQRITSIYAKTFYMGTSFLDYAKRSATWAIYVWCRRTDDIVDSPRAIVEKTMDADLEQWNERLDDIWAGKPWDALDATLCDVLERYPTMSIEPYRDMIKGMIMDVPGIGQARYETFDELYLYCYRVAGTVGLMTLPIMGTAPGYTEKQATEPALALGIALQLTNILRDVGEDALRGRIYLPMEDLERFGVTEDQIMNKIMNSNYRELIKFEIARARKYFDRAEAGIQMLSPDARLPVRSSLDMYRKILDVIEENDYDNFRKRAYVGKFEKLCTLPYSWLKTMSG